MKNVLFIISNFCHGGTNKSLENLLSLINQNEYKPFVLARTSTPGVYLEIFKDYLVSYPHWMETLLTNIGFHRFEKFFLRYLKFTPYAPFYRYVINRLCDEHNIDKLIAFEEGKATLLGSFSKCSKAAWIHCDYEYLYSLRHVDETSIYLRYDQVVCVSRHSMNNFKRLLPECANKVTYIYNSLNDEEITAKAFETIEDSNFKTDLFTIISVGRVAEVKQFYKIPNIVNEINKICGEKKCRWYIIGDGDVAHIKHEIDKCKVHNQVVLLGAKDNPYPFMRQSNLLASTSQSESCPYVVNEARILHIPIISNDYPAAKELIDSKFGVIINISQMAAKICDMIEDRGSIYSKLKHSCKESTYSNESILKSVEVVINDYR